MKSSDIIFTVNDFINYAITNGKKAAYDLLLIAGPDSFEDYNDYVQLESYLNS